MHTLTEKAYQRFYHSAYTPEKKQQEYLSYLHVRKSSCSKDTKAKPPNVPVSGLTFLVIAVYKAQG